MQARGLRVLRGRGRLVIVDIACPSVVLLEVTKENLVTVMPPRPEGEPTAVSVSDQHSPWARVRWLLDQVGVDRRVDPTRMTRGMPYPDVAKFGRGEVVLAPGTTLGWSVNKKDEVVWRLAGHPWRVGGERYEIAPVLAGYILAWFEDAVEKLAGRVRAVLEFGGDVDYSAQAERASATMGEAFFSLMMHDIPVPHELVEALTARYAFKRRCMEGDEGTIEAMIRSLLFGDVGFMPAMLALGLAYYERVPARAAAKYVKTGEPIIR